MRPYTFIVLLFLPIAGYSGDYSIDGSTIQSVAIGAHKVIEINCYCSNNVDIIQHNEANLILEITGEESSVGYHGDQTAPTTIQPNALEFKVVKSNDKIILSSQEWTFIHHAFLITKLTVKVPASHVINWSKLDANALEGRGN